MEESDNSNILASTFGQQKRWIGWKYEKVDGRDTKVSYQINGRKASTSNPATWSTYEEVASMLPNIGIVFRPDQLLLGIDIDHYVEDGKIPAEISEIIEKAHTYTEFSPSGTGFHLFLILNEPLSLEAMKSPKDEKDRGFECYTTGRYFTVTEKEWEKSYPIRTVTTNEALDILRLLGYPWKKAAPVNEARTITTRETPLEDKDLLKKMFSSKNGPAIKSLYDGDISPYAGD